MPTPFMSTTTFNYTNQKIVKHINYPLNPSSIIFHVV